MTEQQSFCDTFLLQETAHLGTVTASTKHFLQFEKIDMYPF